jgi:hypothetical protein
MQGHPLLVVQEVMGEMVVRLVVEVLVQMETAQTEAREVQGRLRT